MDKFRAQSTFFNVAAILAVLLSSFSEALRPQTIFLPLIFAVLLLGVPHGSFDTVYARKLFQLKTPFAWFCFVSSYLFFTLLVFFIHQFYPRIFMGLFLLGSTIHFSEDYKTDASGLTRFFYGGAIVVMPFLLHSAETIRIFSLLAPIATDQKTQQSLKTVSLFWAAGLALAVLQCLYQKKPALGLTVFCLSALCIFCPPLLAFSIYFCLMHSPRHILRTLELSSNHLKKEIFLLWLAPTAFVLSTFCAALFKWDGFLANDTLLPVIFIALAALTVPHMLILKKFEKWNLGRPKGISSLRAQV